MSGIDRNHRGIVAGASFGTALIGAAACAVAAATHASAAGAAITLLGTVVNCSTSGAACVSGTNTAAGSGVSGKSTQGTGVTGSSSKGAAGVLGSSTETVGVAGQATDSKSSSNVGVLGTSYNGYGVVGNAPGPHGYGVFGNGSYGVAGSSPSGIGVVAAAGGSEPAMLVASYGQTDEFDVTAGEAGSCSSACAGVEATSAQGYAFLAEPTANLDLGIVLTDGQSNVIFSVDYTGSVGYSGVLESLARTSGGATIKAFSGKTAAPTLEDTGSATLVGGVAVVALDRTFAASIDPRSGYRVFLTPDGDTDGLYVKSKAATSFVVRVAGGSQPDIGFDYRIVATPLGQAGKRMAVIDPATLSHARKPPSAPPAKATPATQP